MSAIAAVALLVLRAAGAQPICAQHPDPDRLPFDRGARAQLLVGFTGQISIGHAAFFGLGAFTSAISAPAVVPVFFAIPLARWSRRWRAGVRLPAARLEGALSRDRHARRAYILFDFFLRAEWFTGGVVPATAAPFSIFGFTLQGDRQYFYVVLA